MAGVVPLAVVTEILTWPARCAGAVAMIEVDEVTVKDAVDVPNLTLVAVENPVPVIVTRVPPSAGPPVRESELMVGPWVNLSAGTAALSPPGVVTRTSTEDPKVPDGLTTVSRVPPGLSS